MVSRPGTILAILLKRAATARQARIDHEIAMRGKSAFGKADAVILAVAVKQPGIGFIAQIGDHDLVEDLAMHRGIFDWHLMLHPAI